jgi:hypothetical protein
VDSQFVIVESLRDSFCWESQIAIWIVGLQSDSLGIVFPVHFRRGTVSLCLPAFLIASLLARCLRGAR